ncbi:uncharacterized protein LOC121639805 isoform X2 [Melanotaenia boesemani]|uniref:uncharacterized protein LOC121639805 isoform X2 n=1 Tax=Melanotaenia boesemani TaxID=1250792 RepID=UPI001C055641|nr:uncharacterized protein LOC121639805 isoform X2 [Melanotaenia boesemani]
MESQSPGLHLCSPTFYNAKENDNITIKWDSQIKTDMTHTNMNFLLLSDPPKLLYEMIRGNDTVEMPHQQFVGRVQCDKDALREGRIRLHLFRVRTEDSGNYTFDLAANYDRTMRKWVLEMSELFVLNITQSSDGVNPGLSGNTPANSADAKDQPGGPEQGHRWSNWVITGGVLAVIFVLVVFCAVYKVLRFKICTCITLNNIVIFLTFGK